jgi:hypothetical protein
MPGADLVPEGRRDDKLFAGSFSTGYLQDLTAARTASFGPGEYAGSDLHLAGADEG